MVQMSNYFEINDKVVIVGKVLSKERAGPASQVEFTIKLPSGYIIKVLEIDLIVAQGEVEKKWYGE